ncbi:HAD family hydrolase [Halobacteriales archaeon QS_4_62_28]|nr:MAG: HAD family hydrolase [Halobacteriales archaeon QS_4_62_28]
MSRGVIVDLDGTVYHGDSLLPGAGAALDSLRASGARLLFFSNNPTHDGGAYVERLREMGLGVDPGEACSAADVTVEYLQADHAGDAVFFIGDDGIADILSTNGVTLTDDPGAADVLLASWEPEFHYSDMVDALWAYDDDTTFLGTDPDRTFPSENGAVAPGSGAIINAVAGVIEAEPDRILGKPSPEATRIALDRLDVPPTECLVVGDRLSTDIAMGERAGMETVLVLTGITDRADLVGSQIQPDHVIDSLADLDTVLDES